METIAFVSGEKRYPNGGDALCNDVIGNDKKPGDIKIDHADEIIASKLFVLQN